MKVEPRVVSSTTEFLNEVFDLRKEWDRKPHEDLWFRGEDCFYQTALQPRLYRKIKNVPDALEQEDFLFVEFKRCAVQLAEVEPEDDWEWYPLMQHYGGPTRLLDWTDSALNRSSLRREPS